MATAGVSSVDLLQVLLGGLVWLLCEATGISWYDDDSGCVGLWPTDSWDPIMTSPPCS